MSIMEEKGSRKRSRVDPTDISFSSPEVKRIKEDLLESFDEDEFFLASHDELESFMKSFQEEILTSTPVVDLTSSESCNHQSQPELGFLREASDNELGLPPWTGGCGGESEEENIGNNKRVRVESSAEWAGTGLSDGIGGGGSELWRFDSEIPSFDNLEFEEVDINRDYYKDDEYVVIDGLFDYSDMGFGFSDLSWRPEILPAK